MAQVTPDTVYATFGSKARLLTALQIVWTLASPDVSRMLCDVRGWTAGEYAAWLEETLAGTLLT